ncbi:MAG TPA: tRNA pseudouridine synthase A, partial [Nitrolancea sp.]|nr:tRNA pseudouridine synthase A [Nitrolancea sp.]
MTAERWHFRIDLGYDGTDFFGSQRQRDRRTVQQVVEEALSRLSNHDVRIDLAGRTDRGVHAVGQVASGEVSWRGEEESLRYALDSLTPDDVSILGVSRASDRFHARFSARSREYRYRIWNGPYPSTLLKRYVWHCRDDIDIVAMSDAAELLQGEHNFAAFAGAGLGVPWSAADCVRTVFASDWRLVPNEWEVGTSGSRLLEYRIRATGFLPHMVRDIVGSLCAVG